MAAYDAALRVHKEIPQSLFGRGIAKRRLGDRAGGDADLTAARAQMAGIDDFFKRWDVIL